VIDWSTLVAPAPPPRREVLPAFAAAFVGVVVVVTVQLKSMWGDGRVLGGVACTALLLTFLTTRRPWIASLAAVGLVILSWKVAMTLDRAWLPEQFRTVSPHTIIDFPSSLSLLILRVGLLAVPVAVTLALCMALPMARVRFRQFFRIGDWQAGIRWPLPWWGVPTMPIWLFVAIGLPFALPSFIPMINWQVTQERWAQLPLSVWLMIPVIAFANAFLEEFVFRVGLLSLFGGALSCEAAAIPAAAIFGFVHFYGGFPSGLAGSLLLSVGGFVLCYLVIAQRGMSAALAWHLVMDLVILSFVL
jgi:membrane protease YdiL (CAAX protease family)